MLYRAPRPPLARAFDQHAREFTKSIARVKLPMQMGNFTRAMDLVNSPVVFDLTYVVFAGDVGLWLPAQDRFGVRRL